MTNKESVNKLREQLLLPERLLEMLKAGSWENPGDTVMQAKVPFIHDPLEFLPSRESMLSNSGPLMAADVHESPTLGEYRGSRSMPRDLPWVDVEKMLVIACNKNPGDDVAIALDYRPSSTNPRVVGTEWVVENSTERVEWRAISPSFDSFVELLGLDS